MLSIIVAIAENNAIGKAGGLLCHLPADLRHFKAVTQGRTVIMGERTFFSLPRHPLPNRRNIVLTDQAGKTFDGAEAAYSISEIMDIVRRDGTSDTEYFIIGGGMVYRQFMPLADRLYITHIRHAWPDADTFFPEIRPDEWELTEEELHTADENNPYDYTFNIYNRKK